MYGSSHGHLSPKVRGGRTIGIVGTRDDPMLLGIEWCMEVLVVATTSGVGGHALLRLGCEHGTSKGSAASVFLIEARRGGFGTGNARITTGEVPVISGE